MRSRDRFRGCLIGGAAGDALGYAIEFNMEGQIFRRFGERGITRYDLTDGVAEISDDTQMTLFTANGILTAAAKGTALDAYPRSIGRSYRDWLRTQESRYSPSVRPKCAWLGNIAALYSPRAPGNTCLGALHGVTLGSVDEPVNYSKGCGGVMRVAPIGLYFNGRGTDRETVCRLGAEAAALTHGHALGWMPGAALALIIHEVAQDDAPIDAAVRHALDTVESVYGGYEYFLAFRQLMEKALELAGEDLDDLDAIHELGMGWVGDEALAIAVYCAVRHQGDIDATLIAAVNHSGDSDSTGAIAGNIAGARAGFSGIPEKYLDRLELRDLILELADDLWLSDGPGVPKDADEAVWRQKYIDIVYGRPGESAGGTAGER